ncbi:hypothetical protein SAMN05421837_102116 [Amycolatopsis pretoriensis]|uniref:Uncharacterized protein n=1 Tax=Amycolatopsis pretoriensis TaxID=218821 RepID=A0A1H5QB06_9PSEU|nr:hypothetical protein [Amycolatopsis pretoriensis]SEF23323.1 hypothetical protein SAMN05421837_102116 [Amycolatopsis pretoriensis]
MSLAEWVVTGGPILGALGVTTAAISIRNARKAGHEQKFRDLHESIRREAPDLRQRVLDDCPGHWRLPGTSLLAQPGWVPEAPYDLDEIELAWADRPGPAAPSKALPAAKLGRQGTYSSALREVAGLRDLFDGTVYRLLDARLDAGGKRMTFTESSYFEYLDTSEVLAFEAVSRKRSRRRADGRRTYRRRLADPFSFANRVVPLGINTLTLRVEGDRAGFFLLDRDARKVVNNSRMLSALPSGEFTPSDRTREALANDRDLWKNIMREYAEEFLGTEEAFGQGGRWIDYENESPYAELNQAKRSGKLKIKVLGFGIDPLPWKPELLTVCLIDADVFDSVFAAMVERNDEGLLLTGRNRQGLPFDADTVRLYGEDEGTSPDAAACLELAWRFRAQLGLAGRGED